MANIPKPAGANVIWANSGTRVDPGLAKAATGWVVELPPYQYQNWLDWKQDSFIAHINQHGIPQWDSATEYQGSISYVQGSNGIVYRCLATNSNVDPINPLNSSFWKQAWEDYGSVAVVSNSLNAHILNYQTLAGIGNTAAARFNLSVWSRAETDSRYAALHGDADNAFAVAPATLPEHAIRLGQLTQLLTQATETQAGIAKIATNGLVAEGLDDTSFVTPKKGANVYLSKTGNLQGLQSPTVARSNLGLGSAAVEAATAFLRASNNLADLPDKVAARANLGITSTAIQQETYFLRAGQNLADVVNKPAARVNLGLADTATTPLYLLMQKGENLAGLTNVGLARANLGLSAMATADPNNVMFRSNNLGDVGNVQAARNNLGLGNAATMNAYGTTGSLDFTTSWNGSVGYSRHPNGMVESYIQSAPVNGNQFVTLAFPFNYGQILDIQITGIMTQGVGLVELMVQGASYTSNSVTVYVRRLAGNDGGVQDDRIKIFVRVIGFVA